MYMVNLQDAQPQLAELIEHLLAGEEVAIADHQGQVMVRLQSEVGTLPPRRLGGLRGALKYISDDFDAPLNDFKDYQ